MENDRRSGQRGGRGGRRGALPALVVVLALLAGSWRVLGADSEAAYSGPSRTPARGPLRISVTETGTVEAREKVVLKCEVDERSTTITYIVPEGTRVEEGDLVVELDASVLQDELYDEEIDVLDTEAEFLAAKEELEVVKNQAQADLAQAELTLRFAREDVRKYEEGEYPKQLMEVTNNLKLAEERLQQARDRLEWTQKLNDNGFVSGAELDRDRLAFQSAELEVELARADIGLLEDYTHERQLAQLRSDVEQAELALERVRRRSKAQVVQARTNLQAREKQLQRQRAQLADIQRQVERCTITAPVSGMVVYATTGQGGWRGNDEPLAVGREVREQEELVHIPVADAKSARVKVHESALEKVRVGQSVTITADAAPGRGYEGRVARISPLPDAQSQWLNPDLKVYETEIHLVGDLAGLRTGMTCRAEILVEEYEDALYLPLHCVVRVDGAPTVFLVEEGGLVPRRVEVGLDNNHMIRIVSGLEEDALVALAPPLDGEGGADAPGGAPTGRSPEPGEGPSPAAEDEAVVAGEAAAPPAGA